MYEIGINIGFITNSSSCIYHFPPEILEDAQVKALLKRYGVTESGYVGEDMWNRGECESLLMSPRDKALARERLGPSIEVQEAAGIVTIYGDEYPGFSNDLTEVLVEACGRLGLSHSRKDFN